MSKVIRILFIPIFIIAIAFFLVLLAAGFVEMFIWASGLFGVQHSLGVDTQASKNYDTVSGYLPMVVTALGFSGLLATAWHHLNCHEAGCWRIGKYPIAGGQYKSCRKHHPDPAVQVGITAANLRAANDKYQASLSK